MEQKFKVPKVKLLYADKLLTTVNSRRVTDSGIILTDNELGEVYTRQTVVATGPNSTIKIGDEVELNFDLFPEKREAPKNGIGKDKVFLVLPVETIDGERYLFLSQREVKWVYPNEKIGEVH